MKSKSEQTPLPAEENPRTLDDLKLDSLEIDDKSFEHNIRDTDGYSQAIAIRRITETLDNVIKKFNDANIFICDKIIDANVAISNNTLDTTEINTAKTGRDILIRNLRELTCSLQTICELFSAGIENLPKPYKALKYIESKLYSLHQMCQRDLELFLRKPNLELTETTIVNPFINDFTAKLISFIYEGFDQLSNPIANNQINFDVESFPSNELLLTDPSIFHEDQDIEHSLDPSIFDEDQDIEHSLDPNIPHEDQGIEHSNRVYRHIRPLDRPYDPMDIFSDNNESGKSVCPVPEHKAEPAKPTTELSGYSSDVDDIYG